MAFQSVSKKSTTKDPVKLTNMEVGDEVTFYPLSFRESAQYPGTYSILAQDENGERFYINTAGNVKHDITDGRLKLGLFTKIVRLEDYMGKKSKKMTSNFDVQQDPDRALVLGVSTANSSDEGFDAISSSTTATVAEIRGNEHRDAARAAVTKQAAKLAASIRK